MASQWFYARDGKKHGPFSTTQLRDMAASGDLLPTDLIKKEGMSGWRKAGDSPKLFENAVLPKPHELQQLSSDVEAPSRDRFASLKEQARNAVHAAGLAAEKTKLLTVTLPAAYVELGQHCFETRSAEKHFPKEMADLDRLAVEGPKASPAAAQISLTDRVKSIASKGIEVAKKQKAAVERNLILGRLGKKAFERFGESAGPPQISSLIASSLARLDELDAKLAESAGAVARPRLSKKLLFGGLASAGCVAVFVFGVGLSSASRQRGEQGNAVVAPPETVPMIPSPVEDIGRLTKTFVDGTKKDTPNEMTNVTPMSPVAPPPIERPKQAAEPYTRAYETSDLEARNTRYAPPTLPLMTEPDTTLRLGTVLMTTPDSITWGQAPESIIFSDLSYACDPTTGKQLFPPSTEEVAALISSGNAALDEARGNTVENFYKSLDKLRDCAYTGVKLPNIITTYTHALRCSQKTKWFTSVIGLTESGAVVAAKYAFYLGPEDSRCNALAFFSPESKDPLAVALPRDLDEHITSVLIGKEPNGTENTLELLRQRKALPVFRWLVLPRANKIFAEIPKSFSEDTSQDRYWQAPRTLVCCDIGLAGVTVSHQCIPKDLISLYDTGSWYARELSADSSGAKVSMRLAKGGEERLFFWDVGKPEAYIEPTEMPIAYSPDGSMVLHQGPVIRKTHDWTVVSAVGRGSAVQEGSGWVLGGRYLITRQDRLLDADFVRHEDDVFVCDGTSLRPICRLRNVGAQDPAGGGELKMEKRICVSPDGRKVAVLVQGPGFNDNRSKDRKRLNIWDIERVVQDALTRQKEYPKGDGAFNTPLVMSRAELAQRVTENADTAKMQFVGKWIAITDYNEIEWDMDSPERAGNYLLHLFHPGSREAVVRVFVPRTRRPHLERLNSILTPPIIAECESVTQESGGRYVLYFKDGDVVPPVAGGYEGVYVPREPAPPMTLAKFRELKKGMSLSDVRVLFGGAGEERWEELRERATDMEGRALTYNEWSQRITVTYKGEREGENAVLVFEGKQQDGYTLTFFQENGLR